jgi:hypothetical protein
LNTKVRKYLIDAARQKGKFVYYSDIVTDCGLKFNLHNTNGQKQLKQILDDISVFECNAGRPLLSAMAIYKDVRKNDHGDGFYYTAEKLGKGNARKLKRDLYGFAEAEACRVFWQNEESYNKFNEDAGIK